MFNCFYQSRCHPARSSLSESSSPFLRASPTLFLFASKTLLLATFISSATSFASLHSLGSVHTFIDFPFELAIRVSFSSM